MLWATASGCGQDAAPELPIEPGPDGSTDVVHVDVASEVAADSSDDALDAGPGEDADAAPEPVVVGLTPTASASDDGAVSATADADAILLALSSGARALVVERDWSELASPTAEPPTPAWHEIEQICSLLSEQRRVLFLSVKTVEATADRRPADIVGTAWNQAPTRQELHQLVDQVYAVCGDALGYLSLGLEVDRYLDSHVSLSPPFTQFALDASDYARTHPARPTQAAIGWTWTAGAWLVNDGMKETNALVEASDAVMLTYTPLDASGHAAVPGNVATDLSMLADKIKTHPIVLQRAVYPSSELIGGSEAAQAQFIDALFGAVVAHRARFPFVGAGLLHDPSPEQCVAYAQAQGDPQSAELYAAWCSVGLRDRQGAAKPAFSSFIAAAAGLLEP